HDPVQVDGSRQRSTSLLPLTGHGIQRAETPMAVNYERAHAEFFGQCQGLLIVGFGQRDIGGIGMGIDGAKLVQYDRFVSVCLLLSGEVERLAGVLPGLLAAPLQETNLAEPDDPESKSEQPARVETFADRLLQQCAPRREAPLECRNIA